MDREAMLRRARARLEALRKYNANPRRSSMKKTRDVDTKTASLRLCQFLAMEWLVANDPEAADFWFTRPDGEDYLASLDDNVRDFGPNDEGSMILALAKVYGWKRPPARNTHHRKCEDCLSHKRCQECGGHVHNNSACGDPECCGRNYDYCYDCGQEHS